MTTSHQNISLLERALQIAVAAHAGQKDKAGDAYIFHPIRIMSRCISHDAKIIGLLHDTVEDTDVTLEYLQNEGFPEHILKTLELLTHDKDVPYDTYIEELMCNPLAVEVKMADLEDNSNIRRLKEITPKDVERLQKYLRAYRRLQEHQVSRFPHP